MEVLSSASRNSVHIVSTQCIPQILVVLNVKVGQTEHLLIHVQFRQKCVSAWRKRPNDYVGYSLDPFNSADYFLFSTYRTCFSHRLHLRCLFRNYWEVFLQKSKYEWVDTYTLYCSDEASKLDNEARDKEQ